MNPEPRIIYPASDEVRHVLPLHSTRSSRQHCTAESQVVVFDKAVRKSSELALQLIMAFPREATMLRITTPEECWRSHTVDSHEIGMVPKARCDC